MSISPEVKPKPMKKKKKKKIKRVRARERIREDEKSMPYALASGWFLLIFTIKEEEEE